MARTSPPAIANVPPNAVATPAAGVTADTRATPPPAGLTGVPPVEPSFASPSAPPATPLAAPGAEPPASLAMAEPTRPVPDQPEFRIDTATEQQILDHVSAEGAPDPTVFRFKSNQRILVLDFASLLNQGRMLNRVAALAEKSGLPHDRLLSDVELDTAVRAGGDTVETYYYGHDYGASELLRFFALSDRDNVHMVAEEDGLRRLIRQAGWFEPNARAALISIPQVGADRFITRSARATILHHELSHGEYFTNPAYVTYVHRFWTQTLTAAERERVRRHLRSLGYDTALEEVMENEAQAYLMFTESAEFFTPDMFGMSKARVTELRNLFFRAKPSGWLRDSLGRVVNMNNTAAAARP